MQGQAPEPRRDPPHHRDASSLRISDEDRHRVAEVLRQAAGEGRIDLDELDERLEAAYSAKTYGELVPITMDLPVSGATGLAAPQPAPRPEAPASAGPLPRLSGSVAVMSQTKRVGPWVVPDGHTAFALMGEVVLDLREARFEGREVTVNANAVMGEVKIVVNAGTSVVVEGVGVMGEYTEQRAKVPFDPRVGGPVVRVRGLALMGSVHVRRQGPPGEGLRKRLGWHGH
ncbi:MAG TPA: DUF1707 domain-containing protein [Nocardioidaceae bacterium]|nr:DUF1707 domain-containing protein [Nocardioidaceae bacterium]